MDDRCTAFFGLNWRCVFVKSLYGDSKKEENKEIILELSGDDKKKKAFKRFLEVLKLFGSRQQHVRAECMKSVPNKEICDGKNKEKVSSLNLDKLMEKLLKVLGPIESFSKHDSYHKSKLYIFCSTFGQLFDEIDDDSFDDWTMDELYCLLVYWCQRYVHDEWSGIKFENGFSISKDDKKRVLEFVEEFRNIMINWTPDESEVKRRLNDAQIYARIDKRLQLEALSESKNVEDLCKRCRKLGTEISQFNELFFEPFKCCMSGWRQLTIMRVKSSENKSNCVSVPYHIVYLIFMQPSFYYILSQDHSDSPATSSSSSPVSH